MKRMVKYYEYTVNGLEWSDYMGHKLDLPDTVTLDIPEVTFRELRLACLNRLLDYLHRKLENTYPGFIEFMGDIKCTRTFEVEDTSWPQSLWDL